MALRRYHDFGRAELNLFLDRICDELARIGGGNIVIPNRPFVPEDREGRGFIPLVNNGEQTLVPGEIGGIDASGKVARALAGSETFIRASFFCGSVAAPGKAMETTVAGIQKVLVESGIAPALGDPAWLSASSAGRVTNLAPEVRQLVGQFVSALDESDGKAFVMLNISTPTGK